MRARIFSYCLPGLRSRSTALEFFWRLDGIGFIKQGGVHGKLSFFGSILIAPAIFLATIILNKHTIYSNLY